jgi:DNA-binding HxlR family transcriptional regulator
MKLPEKYSYLKLLDKQEQIIILELMTKKDVRTNSLYKMGIIKSYPTLYKYLDNLIERQLVKKIEHNKSNITYELTAKGLNLACILASNETMFKTHIGDIIFIANFGREIKNKTFTDNIKKFFLDYFKRYYDYRIDVNRFQ